MKSQSPIQNPKSRINAMIFRGAYTAIITPFTEDGSRVDLARLEEQIQYQIDGGVSGIVPCGTTGESPTLAEDEHIAIIETAVRLARPRGLQVIAGAGSNSTAHASHLHKLAQSLGADASLQVNPYYNKPSQEGLYRHFMTVADSCDLPIVLYNIPGRTAVSLSIQTIERLAKHPHIQAIKDATGSVEMCSEVCARTEMAVLSGDDPLTLPMASVGAAGVVSVISNLVPNKVAEMCHLFHHDDWPAARRLHYELFGLARGLLSLDTNPVPVKAAMMRLGRDSGAVRLPLAAASDQTLGAINKLLEASSLARAAVAV